MLLNLNLREPENVLCRLGRLVLVLHRALVYVDRLDVDELELPLVYSNCVAVRMLLWCS